MSRAGETKPQAWPAPAAQDAAAFDYAGPTLQAQIDALKSQVDQLASLIMLQYQAITDLQRKTGGKE